MASDVGKTFTELPDAALFEGPAAEAARVFGWVVIEEGVRHSGDAFRPLFRRCVVMQRPEIELDQPDLHANGQLVAWALYFGNAASAELERFVEWAGPTVAPCDMPNSLRPSAPSELLGVALRIVGRADETDPARRPADHAIGWAKCVLSHVEEPTGFGPIDLGNLEGRDRLLFHLGWYLGDLAAEREIRRFWDDAPKDRKTANRVRDGGSKGGQTTGAANSTLAADQRAALAEWFQPILAKANKAAGDPLSRDAAADLIKASWPPKGVKNNKVIITKCPPHSTLMTWLEILEEHGDLKRPTAKKGRPKKSK